jgi:ABC-type polysaccharide/polyol phosphate export permease
MLSDRNQPSSFVKAATILELIFHAAVRSIRKSHGNAVIGLLINIAQTIMLIVVFYAMFMVLGRGGNGLRGDFLLYLMTGIFLFMCHIKALNAVVNSEGPASAMMKHAPMNTFIAIGAAALGELYIQVLTLFFVLFLYHAAWMPLSIHDPAGAFGMLLLSWFTGVTIGLVLLALKPWAPSFVKLLTQFYSRANMVASGKMFVANTLPGFMLPYFTWNPLFHTIDQARGYAFINYNPHFTSVSYVAYFAIVALVIGLMGEFYTRQRASISWSSKG